MTPICCFHIRCLIKMNRWCTPNTKSVTREGGGLATCILRFSGSTGKEMQNMVFVKKVGFLRISTFIFQMQVPNLSERIPDMGLTCGNLHRQMDGWVFVQAFIFLPFPLTSRRRINYVKFTQFAWSIPVKEFGLHIKALPTGRTFLGQDPPTTNFPPV